MRFTGSILVAAAALLGGCGVPGPSAEPTLDVHTSRRYVEAYPGTTTTLDLRAEGTGLGGPVQVRAVGLPPSVRAEVTPQRATFVSADVPAGAYDFSLVANAPSPRGEVQREVPLRLFVPVTGSILNEVGRPTDTTVRTDGSDGVSADLGPAGGQVTVTTDDGTRFSLTVPPGALHEPTRVRLTPVKGPDWSGFSAARGVRTEPDDLRFWRPVKLDVTFATLPAASGLFWAWSAEGDGRDLLFRSVTVRERTASLSVTRGGASGVGWVRTDALDDLPVPGRPEDRRAQRLALFTTPEESRLTERTYAANVLDRVGRAAGDARQVGPLLQEVSVWEEDLRGRAWSASFAGNVGLTWAHLAEVALTHAERWRAACDRGDADVRAQVQGWRRAATFVPGWADALGPQGLEQIDRSLLACPAS